MKKAIGYLLLVGGLCLIAAILVNILLGPLQEFDSANLFQFLLVGGLLLISLLLLASVTNVKFRQYTARFSVKSIVVGLVMAVLGISWFVALMLLTGVAHLWVDNPPPDVIKYGWIGLLFPGLLIAIFPIFSAILTRLSGLFGNK